MRQPRVSKCRKSLSPLKLEGCREKPGHWNLEVGLLGRSQSCGHPVLWDLQPQRSPSCWGRERGGGIPWPLLCSYPLVSFHCLPWTPGNMQTKQSRRRSREGASEGTRPRTGTLILGTWQILFSKNRHNISGPSWTTTLSHQMESNSLSSSWLGLCDYLCE